MRDSTDDASPACRVCGDPVDETGERRIASVVEGGEAVHYQFCGEDCLESWTDS